MKKYPGAARFVVRYKPRRGPFKGWLIGYTYYKSRIMVRGKSIFLGNFPTAQEASKAYFAALIRYRPTA